MNNDCLSQNNFQENNTSGINNDVLFNIIQKKIIFKIYKYFKNFV